MNISGRIINENSAGIPSLDVLVFRKHLGVIHPDTRGTTDSNGHYSIDVVPVSNQISYFIRISRGALVELYQTDPHDLTQNQDWAVPDITLHSQYISGWIVRDRTTGTAPMLTDNNLIELQIDNELAWTSLCTAIQNAQSSVHLQQYYYQINKLIMQFTDPDRLRADTGAPPPGLRLENLLRDAHGRNVDIQVLVRDVTFLGVSLTSPGFVVLNLLPITAGVEVAVAWSQLDDLGTGLSVALGAALILGPFLGPLLGLVLLFAPEIMETLSTAGMVQEYFQQYLDAHLKMKPFPCDFFHPLHAKYVIIDNTSVHITASPFMNAFFGTQQHWIKDYRYGNSIVRTPVHDVSGRLVGPLMEHIRSTYDRYWNKNGDPATLPNPVVTGQTGNGTGSVQVTRTVYKRTFSDMPQGETGILESYLRAIDGATNYIYLENQYFTEEKIYNALVEKINHSAVQLIVVVNIDMDIPGYNNTERNRINALKRALQGKESQFGFFTIWTQEKPGTLQSIINTYIHSKVAVIDDKWATFGSANLDGFSLRNEGEEDVNVVVYNDVDGLPACSFPAQMRNKLWNEHLFSLDQDNPNVIATPASGGWLGLWKQKAAEKLASITDLDVPASLSRVLEWQGKDNAMDYLKAAGVTNFDRDKIRVLDGIPEAYSLANGAWGTPGYFKS